VIKVIKLAQATETPITKLYVGKANERSETGDITELTRSIEIKTIFWNVIASYLIKE
jgi:hypothetical protein